MSRRRPRAAAAMGGRAAPVTVLILAAGCISGERDDVRLWLRAGQEQATTYCNATYGYRDRLRGDPYEIIL
jgi:hypothetical protein